VFATSGRAQLAYEITGVEGGADVLLIHAGVNDRRSWQYVVERLGPVTGALLSTCAVSARPRTSARTAGRPSPTLWQSSTLLASSGLWSSRARRVARLPSILP
jgi:hypothetical protein